MLKAYPIKKLTWNTWSLLPHGLAFWGSNSYIVKLDLHSGNVASFATSFNQVQRYVNRKDFLVLYRHARVARERAELKAWFSSHPKYAEFETRVMELAQRDPEIYAYFWIRPSKTTTPDPEQDLKCIFLSYRKQGAGNIEQRLADPDTELVILKPGIGVELPRGEPVDQPPVHLPFEVNTSSSGGVVRRRKMKADKSVEKPTVEPSDVAKANFTVVESPTFKEQVAVLSDFPSAEANQHKARVKTIKDDLKAGRLPSKSVGKFYVVDFPSLNRNRGRGQWRVLIARRGDELTLHAIADYHGRQSEDWVVWGG